jgi:hypothetical protein
VPKAVGLNNITMQNIEAYTRSMWKALDARKATGYIPFRLHGCVWSHGPLGGIVRGLDIICERWHLMLFIYNHRVVVC